MHKSGSGSQGTQERPGLLIGELAQTSTTPAKTIRFYEAIGLLPPARRAANGYRLYEAEDIDRLRFIRSARLLGFSLDTLREVLGLRDQGEAPCRHVMELLETKTAEVEARISQLQALREDLEALQHQAASLPDDDIEMKHCVCQLIRTYNPVSGS